MLARFSFCLPLSVTPTRLDVQRGPWGASCTPTARAVQACAGGRVTICACVPASCHTCSCAGPIRQVKETPKAREAAIFPPKHARSETDDSDDAEEGLASALPRYSCSQANHVLCSPPATPKRSKSARQAPTVVYMLVCV